VDGINAEFQGDQTKYVEFAIGNAIEIPRPGFRLRRAYFPTVTITASLDFDARQININIHQRQSHQDSGRTSELCLFFNLDKTENVTIFQFSQRSNPPIDFLSIQDVIELLVSPIVEAIS
jgi:hypothetical protein